MPDQNLNLDSLNVEYPLAGDGSEQNPLKIYTNNVLDRQALIFDENSKTWKPQYPSVIVAETLKGDGAKYPLDINDKYAKDGQSLIFNGRTRSWMPGNPKINVSDRITGNGADVPLDINSQGAEEGQVLVFRNGHWVPEFLYVSQFIQSESQLEGFIVKELETWKTVRDKGRSGGTGKVVEVTAPVDGVYLVLASIGVVGSKGFLPYFRLVVEGTQTGPRSVIICDEYNNHAEASCFEKMLLKKGNSISLLAKVENAKPTSNGKHEVIFQDAKLALIRIQ